MAPGGRLRGCARRDLAGRCGPARRGAGGEPLDHGDGRARADQDLHDQALATLVREVREVVLEVGHRLEVDEKLDRRDAAPLLRGCGHVSPAGEWRFAQWTVDALEPENERRILDAWMAHMAAVSRAAGTDLLAGRVCHWSAAERVHLETAYDNARQRHPTNAWPQALPWFDVLQDVVRAAPVAVTGAFSFGLKAIAKAMHSAGFIASTWPSGPTDGLGAMVATWRAARETTELSKHPLMREVAEYNATDCRVMMEILSWLRANR